MTRDRSPRSFVGMEPGVDEVLGHDREDIDTGALMSIAISLKRIADAMTEPCNEYGETMAQSIYGGISRGMRDGRP